MSAVSVRLQLATEIASLGHHDLVHFRWTEHPIVDIRGDRIEIECDDGKHTKEGQSRKAQVPTSRCAVPRMEFPCSSVDIFRFKVRGTR